MKEKIFVLFLIFCFIIIGFMPSGIEKIGIIENTIAEYVDVSNNTNCIEEDPLVPGWSKDVRLTNNSGLSNHPDVAVDSKNTLHVVWQDDRDDYCGLYHKKSEDGGRHWLEGRRINAPTTDCKTPSIAIDQNDGIHVVWSGATQEEPYGEIYYKSSTDGAEPWGADTRLTYAPGDSFAPRITTHKNTLHIVWADYRDGNEEIYYKKSIDYGNHWGDDVRLTNASGTSRVPTIATSADNVYVLWEDKRDSSYDIYFKKSLDRGETWSNDTAITTGGAMGGNDVSGLSDITIDSMGYIHVVWADVKIQGGREDILYKKSEDFGESWSNSTRITEVIGPADSHMPAMTADSSGNVYIIWKSSNYTYTGDGYYPTWDDICFTKIQDSGAIYSDIIRITHAVDGGRICPRIIIDNDNILHVVWGDDRPLEDENNMEIYYKCTLNPVTEPPITVTGSLNQTTCKPSNSITVSGNAVYNDSIVPNANVIIKILETGDEWNTTTDSNGGYSKTIIAPNTAGNYTIRVTITSGNHTGWKLVRLTVEQESTNGGTTNGGTTNGGTTNGGQQPGGGENKYGNLNYVLAIVAVVAVCVILGVVLVKHRGKQPVKVKEEKKTTQMLRCPKCRKTFSVEVKPKPFNVKCPHCGKEGTIK